jgi:hypothetical protein
MRLLSIPSAVVQNVVQMNFAATTRSAFPNHTTVMWTMTVATDQMNHQTAGVLDIRIHVLPDTEAVLRLTDAFPRLHFVMVETTAEITPMNYHRIVCRASKENLTVAINIAYHCDGSVISTMIVETIQMKMLPHVVKYIGTAQRRSFAATISNV